jgi:hypothetical protein
MSLTIQSRIAMNTTPSLGIFEGQQTLPSTVVFGFSVPVEQFFI